MTLLNRQLSFAAGSNSLDPYGYRVIQSDAGTRMIQLAAKFPNLRRFLNPSAMIVSAYPAALGLTGIAPFVDTYLHPATFVRSMRLAKIELRPVIMVAQPLAGADLLTRMVKQSKAFPTRLLWASGGYYFPVSLERHIKTLLRQFGCEVTILHAYGLAEIEHSCFAAIDRYPSGVPRFHKISNDVNTIPVKGSDQLILERNGRCENTGDKARFVDGAWRIENDTSRLDPVVRETIESWNLQQWERRTGYLYATDNGYSFQLREGVVEGNTTDETCFHEFWQRYGGSLTTKPQWKVHRKIETTLKIEFNRSLLRL